MSETKQTWTSLGEHVGACQRGALRSWLVAALVLCVGWGCKPENEPARRDEPANVPDVQEASHGSSDDAAVAALGSLRVVMHDDPPTPGSADKKASGDQESPTAKPREKSEPAAEDRRLSASVLETLIERAREPANEGAKVTAKRLNSTGLKLHKRLDLEKAIIDYRAALDAWAGHLYSRYNLACALQLQRRPQESLDQLAVLRGLHDRGGLDFLREARLDDDFTAARSDLRFRDLTGYLPVEVVAGAPSAQGRVEPTTAKLRVVHIPASPGERWPTSVERDTIYVRADDPSAGDMADEMSDALGVPVERHVNARLGPKRPLVLVLANAPMAPPEKAEEAEHSPESFIGVPLTSEENGVLNRLHLKERRFFTWETRHEDGRRVGRTGTYYFLRGKLHLDFQETSERPSEALGDPEIEVHRGKREHHAVSTDGVTLKLGELTFKRR